MGRNIEMAYPVGCSCVWNTTNKGGIRHDKGYIVTSLDTRKGTTGEGCDLKN